MGREREGERRGKKLSGAALRGLKRLELFRDVPERELEALAVVSRRWFYREGHLILLLDDPESGIVGVESGAVRLSRMLDGAREITLATYRVGDIIEPSLLSLEVRPKGILQAMLDRTAVEEIPRESFEEFLARHPEIALRAINLIGGRLAGAWDQVEEQTLYESKARLAHSLANRAERRGQELVVVDTHQRLASEIGIRPDQVTRALGQLRDEGLVVTGPGRRRIVLRDFESLASYGHRRRDL